MISKMGTDKERKNAFFKILCVCMAVAFFSVAGTGMVLASDEENTLIVSIDTNRILEKHPAFLKAQEDFQGEMQQMQQQLEGMGEEEQMMAQQQMQQQLQQRGQELQEEALAEVRAHIAKIADEKGYKYVVDANALISGGKDITDEVMEEMDILEE